MISGAGPRVAPDVRAVQAFQAWVAFADAADIKIESFVGMPIVLPDGALFGTLCGFGSRVQSDSLSALEPLLVLLSAVLEADTTATNAARERESALRESDVDVLTGPSGDSGGGSSASSRDTAMGCRSEGVGRIRGGRLRGPGILSSVADPSVAAARSGTSHRDGDRRGLDCQRFHPVPLRR